MAAEVAVSGEVDGQVEQQGNEAVDSNDELPTEAAENEDAGEMPSETLKVEDPNKTSKNKKTTIIRPSEFNQKSLREGSQKVVSIRAIYEAGVAAALAKAAEEKRVNEELKSKKGLKKQDPKDTTESNMEEPKTDTDNIIEKKTSKEKERAKDKAKNVKKVEAEVKIKVRSKNSKENTSSKINTKEVKEKVQKSPRKDPKSMKEERASRRRKSETVKNKARSVRSHHLRRSTKSPHHRDHRRRRPKTLEDVSKVKSRGGRESSRRRDAPASAPDSDSEAAQSPRRQRRAKTTGVVKGADSHRKRSSVASKLRFGHKASSSKPSKKQGRKAQRADLRDDAATERPKEGSSKDQNDQGESSSTEPIVKSRPPKRLSLTKFKTKPRVPKSQPGQAATDKTDAANSGSDSNVTKTTMERSRDSLKRLSNTVKGAISSTIERAKTANRTIGRKPTDPGSSSEQLVEKRKDDVAARTVERKKDSSDTTRTVERKKDPSDTARTVERKKDANDTARTVERKKDDLRKTRDQKRGATEKTIERRDKTVKKTSPPPLPDRAAKRGDESSDEDAPKRSIQKKKKTRAPTLPKRKERLPVPPPKVDKTPPALPKRRNKEPPQENSSRKGRREPPPVIPRVSQVESVEVEDDYSDESSKYEEERQSVTRRDRQREPEDESWENIDASESPDDGGDDEIKFDTSDIPILDDPFLGLTRKSTKPESRDGKKSYVAQSRTSDFTRRIPEAGRASTRNGSKDKDAGYMKTLRGFASAIGKTVRKHNKATRRNTIFPPSDQRKRMTESEPRSATSSVTESFAESYASSRAESRNPLSTFSEQSRKTTGSSIVGPPPGLDYPSSKPAFASRRDIPKPPPPGQTTVMKKYPAKYVMENESEFGTSSRPDV